MMIQFKLLVINPQDEQQLIKVEISGLYYDESRVIFDERKDGTFPIELIDKVGCLKRYYNKLVIDDSLVAAFEAKKIVDAEKKLLDDVIANRKKEYPSMDACIHAILDGDLDAIQAQRFAVKAKYPKP